MPSNPSRRRMPFHLSHRNGCQSQGPWSGVLVSVGVVLIKILDVLLATSRPSAAPELTLVQSIHDMHPTDYCPDMARLLYSVGSHDSHQGFDAPINIDIAVVDLVSSHHLPPNAVSCLNESTAGKRRKNSFSPRQFFHTGAKTTSNPTRSLLTSRRGCSNNRDFNLK
jgi:hypothetical protein